MSKGAALRIAVVGASSLIGAAVIDELRARKMPFAELHALDDERNVGRAVTDDEGAPNTLPVGDVAGFDFSRVDLVFFCGRSMLSERYAEAAAEHAWVIDGSAAFRTRADVPLVAADVNAAALDAVGARGLIALPGSISVALCTVLAPLHALAGLERAVNVADAADLLQRSMGVSLIDAESSAQFPTPATLATAPDRV